MSLTSAYCHDAATTVEKRRSSMSGRERNSSLTKLVKEDWVVLRTRMPCRPVHTCGCPGGGEVRGQRGARFSWLGGCRHFA